MSKNSSNSLLLIDVRSTYNVGAIMRSCAVLGISQVYVFGATPYPKTSKDARLPHVYKRATEQIKKTALGAENSVVVTPVKDLKSFIKQKKDQNNTIYALEHHKRSRNIASTAPHVPWLLIAGSETDGIPDEVLVMVDEIIEIPSSTLKQSLNVSVAASIALFQLTKDESQLKTLQQRDTN